MLKDSEEEAAGLLEEYFDRIGWRGEKLDTSLETLSLLHRRHLASIPFENLDVLLGKRIVTDAETVWAKLVEGKRGGYCFEQNSLFKTVLEAVGFSVSPMLARVRWQVPPEIETPLSHMVLKVEFGEKAYLADVGFGGVGLIEPIEIATGIVQHERFEPRRLVERGSCLAHQVLIEGVWQDAYQFELKPAARVDLEVGNWYSCTYPNARFLQTLLVARATEDKRIVLFNTTLTERPYRGEATVREIESPEALIDVLEEKFGLVFDPGTRFVCPGLVFSGAGKP